MDSAKKSNKVLYGIAAYLDCSGPPFEQLSLIEQKRERKNISNSFLQDFKSRLDDMITRELCRPCTGITYPGPYAGFWQEATSLYVEGYFYPCIAFVGITAERICKDILRVQKIVLNGQELSDDKKSRLARQNFIDMIKTLSELGLIKNPTANLLNKIRNTRNRYVHAQKKLTPEKDAVEILANLSQVIKDVFSVFNDYDLQDGILVHKK